MLAALMLGGEAVRAPSQEFAVLQAEWDTVCRGALFSLDAHSLLLQGLLLALECLAFARELASAALGRVTPLARALPSSDCPLGPLWCTARKRLPR